MEDQEIIREFLIESNENLARLDQEMVELEQRPKDPALLGSIFRTIHTIKGTCGLLGFGILEAVAHLGEDILSQLRDGHRELTPELVTVILESVDAIKQVLVSIETTGSEGTDRHAGVCERLEMARKGLSARAPAAAMPAETAADLTPDAPTAAPAEKAASIGDSTIRVDVGLLDKLMNLVGELVLTRNQILQFNAQQEDATLNVTSQRLNLITTELQEGVMKTRMQPIGVVWNKLPRLVRDLAASLGKQIHLEMDGAETELDRTIIEAIKDPLTHIVRNCCDHGIERPEARTANGKPAAGKVMLRAYHEGGQVNIEIADDGAGIDTERVKAKALQKGLLRPDQSERMSDREILNLIFLPGMSTAEKVTSVSGRGVGMDVVKSNIEKIGGTVDLLNRPGLGATLKVKIPLTLAIIPGLIVTAGERRSAPRALRNIGDRFVIPQVSLRELIRLEGEAGKRQIERIQGTPVYRRRGQLLPIVYLNEVLETGDPIDSSVINIVVLQAEDRQFGLVVDGISDTQEIVVKPLGKQLKGLNCYAGATIMGDGQVALILDVLGIGQRSGVVREAGERPKGETAGREPSGRDGQTFLLFRAGSFARVAVPLSLVARLEEFPQSKIEHASGRRVVQYREQILPLVSLAAILEDGAADTAGEQDPAQVIVFTDGGRSVGLLVDQILDIVDEDVTARWSSDRDGLLGSAVIGKRLADLLDLHAVIEAADHHWFGHGERAATGAVTVLVAESSTFTRGLVRNSLEMAGYHVVEAIDAREALRVLEERSVHVVVASRNLLSQIPKLAGIPTLVLQETPGEDAEGREPPGETGDPRWKYDREAMLRSVARLAAAVSGDSLPLLAGDRS
jgi:two-component system chemotaxis sensor kinase CheA